ncbi:MAG: glycosyltransferase [Saprospiraceae bacterium]|nr:MAG: group 1 glycosyl transferase [Bacteroidetes bacterium OLB9]MCO6464269.1 glycosyltransferase [Saprospiraceae bacterium]MCZ2337838.1 glycosyltransferase [Chitinophagales bacterium]
MNKRRKIYCVVTNDLIQDQRMHRICNTLIEIGCDVMLIGRQKPDSIPLGQQKFRQKRLKCFFNKGPFFYMEYNIRVLLYLILNAPYIIYSVDTDTLAACSIAKWIRNRKIIFDSHEYFTEVPELTGRKFVKKIWEALERVFIPHVNCGLTVSESLATILSEKYKVPFHTIYNVPMLNTYDRKPPGENKYLLYQGMLNKGRGLEQLIAAMPMIPSIKLIIAGEGDLSHTLRKMNEDSPAKSRIIFAGWQTPDQLQILAREAWLGVNLLDSKSLNYYYSLANKFFDYMHAGLPSINMDFPEYQRIIGEHNVGYLISDLHPAYIAALINDILKNPEEYYRKKECCAIAAQHYNWQNESLHLQTIFDQL